MWHQLFHVTLKTKLISCSLFASMCERHIRTIVSTHGPAMSAWSNSLLGSECKSSAGLPRERWQTYVVNHDNCRMFATSDGCQDTILLAVLLLFYRFHRKLCSTENFSHGPQSHGGLFRVDLFLLFIYFGLVYSCKFRSPFIFQGVKCPHVEHSLWNLQYFRIPDKEQSSASFFRGELLNFRGGLRQKLTMQPEDHLFDKENHLPNLHFWVPAVRFWSCMLNFNEWHELYPLRIQVSYERDYPCNPSLSSLVRGLRLSIRMGGFIYHTFKQGVPKRGDP